MGYFPKTMDVLPEQNKVPPSEVAFSNDKATGKIIKNTFTYKEFTVTSNSPIQAEVFIHYFPGWRFYINGNEVKPNTSNIYDFVFLDVPKGDNDVIAAFTDTPLITLSNLITLVSIIIFICLVVVSESREFFKKRKLPQGFKGI